MGRTRKEIKEDIEIFKNKVINRESISIEEAENILYINQKLLNEIKELKNRIINYERDRQGFYSEY